MTKPPTLHLTQVVEIRARHDRNRLLATYDPARLVLRLFHRGEIIVVRLDELTAQGVCEAQAEAP